MPFTIRLTDRLASVSEVDGVSLRIDPGSQGTGIAVTDCKEDISADGRTAVVRRGLWCAVLEHRGAQIKQRLQQRAHYRHGRRSRNLRHREPRFSNRRRPQGWLPPSLQHRVDTTSSTVRRLMNLAPVAEIHVEQTAFDVLLLSAETPVSGVDYQHGTLHGFEVREYLLAKWRRACAYCGASGVPLQVEHVQARSRGGSDRVSNLVLACAPCNQAKGTRPLDEFLADQPALRASIQRQLKTPLRDAAAMNATRNRLVASLTEFGLPVLTWTGGLTKYNRTRTGLAKTHTLDALSVGELGHGAGHRIARHPDRVLVIRCTGRGSHARTRPDKFGFPRLYLPRSKRHFGYATGDLVHAVVPHGKKQGAYRGRAAVRTNGYMNIRTVSGMVQGIHHRHVTLLQRADGYGYALQPELQQ